MPYFDDKFLGIMTEWTKRAGAVLLGTGKRLFGEGTIPRAFRLADTRQTSTGAVLHVYERAGGLKYGEVEVGQETVIFDSDG
ncbi:MAG: hypothetical protein A2X36_08000 [Elusimicrobia bacterium GWA2_69_24]|nr:MAG: hypothetical protein A2X36_08000 [Elusimicrobia bacterium GWA2_69_24]